MIQKVSEQTKNAINRKSAYALPNRPSDSGMKPDEIRKAFWLPVTDETESVLAEIDRVVDETNKEFDTREEKIIGAVPHLEELNRRAEDNISKLNEYDGLAQRVGTLAEEAREQASLAKEEADRAEGALADKLDKVTTPHESKYKLYAVTSTGAQTMCIASYSPGVNKVAIYTTGGCLRTSTPRTDNDCANKAYVDQAATQAYERGREKGYEEADLNYEGYTSPEDLAAGYVSKADYEDVEAECQAYSDMLTEAYVDISDLESRVTTLEERLNELEIENTALQDQYNALAAEHANCP